MAAFLFVPGAWHAGWCWKNVILHLRAAGHEAYTPSLAGLAERSHVQDILGVLFYEDLHQVVLVGHSCGGMLIPMVLTWRRQRGCAM